jgi:hypothetical protein
MKLNLFESHDRLIQLQKDQAEILSQGLEDCLKRNPLSLSLQAKSDYVYIYAHPRTDDDGFTKRMLWQPRLGKPKAQTNSYLFRAASNTDIIEVCWMIPPREMWPQYRKGNVTESEIVNWSISMFQNNRPFLEKPYEDDLNDDRIKSIYMVVAAEMDQEKRMNRLYTMPASEEIYQSSSLIVEP